MITAWLTGKLGLSTLDDRVSRLERELAEKSATIAAQEARLMVAEAHSIAGASSLDRIGHRLEVMARAARANAAQLKNLSAEDGRYGAAIKTLEQEVDRIKAALIVLEGRIDAEAEQTRRSVIGLFQKIEATLPDRGVDRIDRTAPLAPG